MRTNEFSDLTLAFYVTYLFFELPTGFLMQRLPTAKYLGLNGSLDASPFNISVLTLDSSYSMGSHDHIELHSKELRRHDDAASTAGLLRKCHCASVSRYHSAKAQH